MSKVEILSIILQWYVGNYLYYRQQMLTLTERTIILSFLLNSYKESLSNVMFST